MKFIKSAELEFIPASHEDRQNPGVWKKVLLTHENLLTGEIPMVNWAKLPVGKSFQLHYHEDMQEIFIMFSGSARMTVDTQTLEIAKGDVVVVDPTEKHTMENTGTVDVEYIVFGISTGNDGKTVVV